MKKSATKTMMNATVREVRKTYRRFLTIFLMAALGAGVFAGLYLANPYFISSVDRFYQRSQVYDYRLTSSLDWDAQSIGEIGEVEGVKAVEGLWQEDALFDTPAGEDPLVYRVHSLTGKVNKASLTQGEVPDEAGECLLDAAYHKGIDIGDKLTLSKTNEDRAREAFTVEEFTVTGFANSPLYTTFERGETAIGDGKLTGFMIVPREAFKGESAVEIDVKLADRSRFMTDAYTEMMDAQRGAWQEKVQTTAESQADRMKKAAEAELKAAKKVLAEKQAQVEEKLAPYKQAMEMAKAELDSISSSISSDQAIISQKERDLPELEKKMKEAQSRIGTVKNKKNKKEKSKQEARKQEYEQAKGDYERAKGELDAAKARLQQRMWAVDKANDKYNKKLAVYTKKETKVSKVLVKPQKRVDEAKEKLRSIQAPVTAVLERSSDESYTTFENDFKILGQATGIYPVLFLLASALGCAAMAVRWTHKRRYLMGLMRAKGMSKSRVTVSNWLYTGSAALLGGVAGYLIGAAVIPGAIWRIYRSGGLNLMLKGSFSPKAFLVSLAVLLVCTLGATWLTSRRMLRESTADLLSGEPPKAGRHLLLEHLPEIWQTIPATGAAALRHVFLYKKRLIASVVGFGLCTALMLAGLGIKDSVSGFERTQYDNIQVADAEVKYTGGQGGEAPTSVMSGVTKIGGKALAFVSEEREIKIGGRTRHVLMMVPYKRGNINHFFVLRDGDDHGLSRPEKGEALISLGLARHEHLKKGDEIVLPAGPQGEKDVTVKIAGIFTNYVNDYVIVRPADLRTADGAADVNSLFVNFAKESDADKSQTALSSLSYVTSVKMSGQNKRRAAAAMSQLRCIAWITAVAAAILAFWFMLELAGAEMNDRRREWRVYRLLGYDRREALTPLFIERVILALIGTVLGLVAGSFLHRRIMGHIVSDVFYIPARIGLLSYVIVFVLMMVFVVIIQWFSRAYVEGRRTGRRKKGKKRA